MRDSSSASRVPAAPAGHAPTPHLTPTIGASQYFTMGFGTIIGVGWVVALGELLKMAGPLGAVLAFLGGGVVMMLVGLCYADMATRLPVSGGEVAYAYEAFGVRASFTAGWFLALAFIATTAFEAISIGWIAGYLLPGLKGPVLYTAFGEPVNAGSLALGLLGMAFITWLNYRGLHGAAVFQDVLTYALIALSLVFVTFGVLGGSTENLKPLFTQSGNGAVRGILAVLVTVPFWYGGFNVIPQVMEEKAPGTPLRSVTRMILVSIAMAGLFYSLVILSSSMSTPWQTLLEMEIPAAGAFESAFDSPLLGRIVLVAALLGLVTTWNAVFIAASRLLFALGRAKIIPAALSSIHPRFHSPSVAVLFVGFVGTCGVFSGRSAIIPIVNVGATCLALAFFITCLGVLRLHHRKGGNGPETIPGGTVTVVLAVLGSMAMLFVSLYQPYAAHTGSGLPLEWWVFLLWILLGAVFWFVARRIRDALSETERRQVVLNLRSD